MTMINVISMITMINDGGKRQETGDTGNPYRHCER